LISASVTMDIFDDQDMDNKFPSIPVPHKK